MLTPVFGLSGTLNLIAVGVLWCALASVAIASLAVGLRIRLGAQLLVAAACWLIIADAAFFDVFAGPFSEPAALVGVMLVAAGVGPWWLIPLWLVMAAVAVVALSWGRARAWHRDGAVVVLCMIQQAVNRGRRRSAAAAPSPAAVVSPGSRR